MKKKDLKKVYSLLIVVGILIVIIFVLISRGFKLNSTSANPDYICVKKVENQPCVIREEDCGPWEKEGERKGKRICIGVQTTHVKYYHVRTECEEGYEMERENRDVGGMPSGRYTADMVYRSERCLVEQHDSVAPIGTVDVQQK